MTTRTYRVRHEGGHMSSTHIETVIAHVRSLLDAADAGDRILIEVTQREIADIGAPECARCGGRLEWLDREPCRFDADWLTTATADEIEIMQAALDEARR